MLGNQPRELPQQIALVLIPSFSMIAFTAAVETLRLANRMSGQRLYAWHLFATDGRAVRASNGIELHPEGDLEKAGAYETVIVCSGTEVQRFNNRVAFSWLRRMARKGVDLGGRYAPAAISWPAPGCLTATAAPSTGRIWPGSWRISRTSR